MAQPGGTDLASLSPELVVAVDAGCRWGLPPGWDALARRLWYFGFDPDREECARLNDRGDEGLGHREFVPVALAETSGPRDVHLTKEPACSSFFPSEEGVLASHPALEVLAPRGVVRVAATRLDEWAAERRLTRVDVMKLDTQGSELEVLRGTGQLIETVSIIETEVEFNPLYHGQALFGDIDRFLRQHGFVLWRLTNLAHYGRQGAGDVRGGSDYQAFDDSIVPFERGAGQLFWANALFVRAALLDGQVDAQARRRAEHFAHEAGYHDLWAAFART